MAIQGFATSGAGPMTLGKVLRYNVYVSDPASLGFWLKGFLPHSYHGSYHAQTSPVYIPQYRPGPAAYPCHVLYPTLPTLAWATLPAVVGATPTLPYPKLPLYSTPNVGVLTAPLPNL